MAVDDETSEQATDPVAAERALLRAAAQNQTFGRPKSLTKAEKIRALHVEIADLRTKGATWDDIAAILSGTIGAKPDTIRQVIVAMRRTKRAKRTKPASSPGAYQKTKRAAQEHPPDQSPDEHPTTGGTGHTTLKMQF